MVLNDSFSLLFSSPGSVRKANDSFNESFSDKNSFAPATIFRSLQKEHDQVSTVLRSHPPTTSQYQNSLNEIINLFERTEDQATIGCQKLVLSVFLKLAANVLSVLGKPNHQPTLYKLAQLIATSVVPDLGPENETEEKTMRKWADRVVIECYIHLLEFPNYQLDRDFSIDDIVEDLGLATGRFQFVKSAVFESARDMAAEVSTDVNIDLQSKFSLDNLADENFLRLILWLFLRQKTFLKSDLLPSLFSLLPLAMNAQEYIKSAECSLLDLKLYVVSLSIVASTTTESGMTTKSPLTVASQLTLTKHQKDCWKAVVDACAGASRRTVAALSRLRTSQLIESVRLIADGSEDVRVLFEAWKHCLQPSATHDDDVHEAIQAVTEKYRSKMNSLLAYGPFYSMDPSTLSNSASRRDMKALFPLQFDYEFVNTTEAEHIGTVINSLEGYMSPQPGDPDENDDEEALQISDSFGDDTFHSFGNTSAYSSGSNSQFFSPLKNNRESMLPSAVSQLIRDESIANSSHVSTKSVILTPTRANAPPLPAHFQQKIADLSFELPGFPNVVVTGASNINAAKNESGDNADDEEDELETALLESTHKHEQSILAQKTPEKAAIVQNILLSPTKDAQTETDDTITSSEESSIISVRYTPKSELKKKEIAPPVYSFDSDEADYEDEGEEEEEYDDEEGEETENEDNDDLLDESQMEDMMYQLLEATITMLRDTRMKKFGIESEKISFNDITDDEMLRKAESKLAKINSDLSITFERLEKLRNPNVTTVLTSKTTAPVQSIQQVSSQPESSKSIDHESKNCLGCQSLSE
ncbi:unnamed protein product [Caenorhabditis brenneri]